MSHHHHETPVIPRSALIGAGLMVLLTIGGAAYARLSGNTATSVPDVAAVAVHELSFDDRDDGAILAYEGDILVAVLPSGEGGFVRGALRALARQRRLGDQGSAAPFRIIEWADGRVSIEDPTTAETVQVNAFGQDNVAAFVRLLDMVRTRQETAGAEGVGGSQENEA